jgi:hypothetical protein
MLPSQGILMADNTMELNALIADYGKAFQSTKLPNNIDWDFIAEREGSRIANGYIPTNKKTGEVIGRSGTTIVSGTDLGQKDPQEKFFRILPKDLRKKLSPYAGKTKEAAVTYLQANPLFLDDTEMDLVDKAEKQIQTERLHRRWRNATGTDFSTLPKGVATPLASVSFQYGTAPKSIWDAAIKEDIPALRAAFAAETKYIPRRLLEIGLIDEGLEDGMYADEYPTPPQFPTAASDLVDQGRIQIPELEGAYDSSQLPSLASDPIERQRTFDDVLRDLNVAVRRLGGRI